MASVLDNTRQKMDHSGWDDMTMQSYLCECRCCDYWRLRYISSVRTIRFYKIIVVVVLIFVTSLALLALSLHCHWSNRNHSDEDHGSPGVVVTDGRRSAIEGEATAEMTSLTMDSGAGGEAQRSLRRAKRENRIRHQSSMKGSKVTCSEFKQKFAKARSYRDAMKLVAGLAAHLCPSKLPSKGHRKNQQQRPPSLIATTTTMMTTTTTKEACPMINVSIVGSYNQTNYGTMEKFRVCGPNNTTRDEGVVAVRKERHWKWMKRAKQKGICVPMPLVIDVKPVKSTGESGSTIVFVKRCSLLYKPIEIEDFTPHCHSVKSAKRTVHFKGSGDYVTSYEVYDDVICRPRVTSEENETDVTHTPSKKHANRCPWPFKRRVALSHCSCRKKAKGSAGYLVYRSCQMVEKGVWRLQHKQQECVRLGHCLPPTCKGTQVYDPGRGRCLPQQRHTTSPAAAAAASASRPVEQDGVVRTHPTRTAAQGATKPPTDT